MVGNNSLAVDMSRNCAEIGCYIILSHPKVMTGRKWRHPLTTLSQPHRISQAASLDNVLLGPYREG